MYRCLVLTCTEQLGRVTPLLRWTHKHFFFYVCCSMCIAIGGFVTQRQQAIFRSKFELDSKPLVRMANTR